MLHCHELREIPRWFPRLTTLYHLDLSVHRAKSMCLCYMTPCTISSHAYVLWCIILTPPGYHMLILYLYFTTIDVISNHSYELSLKLEPEDSPSHLHPPPSTLPTLSPSRLRRTLKFFFNSKGTIVSDVHTPSTLTPSPTSPARHTLGRSLFSKQFSDTSKKGSYDLTNGGFKERDGKRMRLRTNSLSPSIGRKYSENNDHVTGNGTTAQPLPGHVIRVAMTPSDHCNYKCLLVNDVH